MYQYPKKILTIEQQVQSYIDGGMEKFELFSRKWRVVFADISLLHTNQAYVLDPSATAATHTMATLLTER